MFNLEKQIAEWRAEMSRAGIRNAEVLDELEAHLREQMKQFKQTGIPDAEAFQQALSALGDGASLKREFSKVSARSIWSMDRDNLLINLIATWFILAGTNGITSARALLFWGEKLNFFNLVMILMLLVLCSQIFIGVGLFRRRERWRKLALGWSSCVLALFLFGQVYVWFSAPQASASSCMSSLGVTIVESQSQAPSQHQFYRFLALPWPMSFLNIISWVNVGVLVLACLQLTHSRGRRLFHTAPDAVGK
jgi:hypothetical protein